ncbi:NAD-dependent succinate-semialdehyde dehydrogenase [Candidatus Halocynthiibacter alkanivorans]|jgi:succinate-semialdehyde dehydrogenase / glutarate-semialdehyde dehydrogenase|uniref:NAD-dependent succinate-semialdehyde dehydrogenase n=1 Tax=Candidatus Halocynthiibacter alkanivorans TaxID=2267619 RepID=UPI000DF2BD6C|nr:NAD-dependent succinate-semialdehyde dehydrogenase [Candidatus Halocynthiibacter alkanivorans]
MSITNAMLSRLKDASLLRAEGYIGGEWVSQGLNRDLAPDQRSFEVSNPSNGELLATLPEMGAADTRAAIEAAYVAQKDWAARPAPDRANLLRALNDLVVENADDLATIITAEMGKPWAEARGEVLYGASYIAWFAEEARRVYGDIIPAPSSDQRVLVSKQPIGVTGAITPWNFPSAMLARKIAPALAAGCAMVSKPAEQTPLSAIALTVLLERAGIPGALCPLILGTDGPGIGQEMCSNDKLRKLSFTGSTQVGRILMRQGADQIMKLSLELGGNAPFIVFDDADIDAAVAGAMISKYRNNGQTCVCANRIYVQAGVYDAFAAKLKLAVDALKVGDGFEDGVTTGPMIDGGGLNKVEAHIKDALEKGATLLTGGSRSDAGELFFEPTILTGVTSEMLLAREETFGPLAPLFKFDTTDEVIKAANDTEFGLAAYFYTRDMSRVFRVSEALEYGIVGVNTGLISNATAPFGGVKQSGLGREGSKYGLEDYMEIKYVCLGGV